MKYISFCENILSIKNVEIISEYIFNSKYNIIKIITNIDSSISKIFLIYLKHFVIFCKGDKYINKIIKDISNTIKQCDTIPTVFPYILLVFSYNEKYIIIKL